MSAEKSSTKKCGWINVAIRDTAVSLWADRISSVGKRTTIENRFNAPFPWEYGHRITSRAHLSEFIPAILQREKDLVKGGIEIRRRGFGHIWRNRPFGRSVGNRGSFLSGRDFQANSWSAPHPSRGARKGTLSEMNLPRDWYPAWQ